MLDAKLVMSMLKEKQENYIVSMTSYWTLKKQHVMRNKKREEAKKKNALVIHDIAYDEI